MKETLQWPPTGLCLWEINWWYTPRIRHLLTRDRHAPCRGMLSFNGLLVGLNNGLTNRLQRAQNPAARLIRRRDLCTECDTCRREAATRHAAASCLSIAYSVDGTMD